MKNNRIEWVVWSGEGEQGTKEFRCATEIGIKRHLTKEKCHGDRWSFAAPAMGDDYMDSCHIVRERTTL